MTDQAVKEVDWHSHTMAVGRSQLSQSFLVKMLHQILPIGTLIHKYDLVKYTIDCSTCREHNETYDHLDQLKWFHSTLEEHITKEPHLYQQQAWLETYEPMIPRRIHDRDRVTQQRLHTINEYFPPLPAGTADR
jgi:hypothetical protein